MWAAGPPLFIHTQTSSLCSGHKIIAQPKELSKNPNGPKLLLLNMFEVNFLFFFLCGFLQSIDSFLEPNFIESCIEQTLLLLFFFWVPGSLSKTVLVKELVGQKTAKEADRMKHGDELHFSHG